MGRLGLWTAAAVLAGTLGAGCVSTTGPMHGLLITSNVTPVAYGDATVRPVKIGEATARGILGFAWGDAGLKTAMDAGGITKLHHADRQVLSVFGIYARYTTIAYGE